MAAPLGFKTFATGDVLTAADTNGYLMQGIWVFADATARDAAVTSPQEGNACYLKDTDNIMVYSGSAWVTKSAGTGGSNQFYAGKNRIINGDMYINQRSFTSNTATGTYGFDRFKQANVGGTFTVTPQTFALGTAPVSGYEGKNFSRLVTATQSAAGDYAALEQMVESVRSFAGQTVTFSCWAKASTGTPKVGFSVVQNFGTGGSPSANVITSGGTATISTSWARYSFTITLPSISGKTIGTNNDDKLQVDLWTSVGTTISGLGYPAVGIQNVTIDTWGWQLEAGSTATDFQTATGSIGGELALCQRYAIKFGGEFGFNWYGTGINTTTTNANIFVPLPVKMRSAPTLTIPSVNFFYVGVAGANPSAIAINQANATSVALSVTTSGVTVSNANQLYGDSSTSSYLLFTSEL
jgi:hypothetical protein